MGGRRGAGATRARSAERPKRDSRIYGASGSNTVRRGQGNKDGLKPRGPSVGAYKRFLASLRVACYSRSSPSRCKRRSIDKTVPKDMGVVSERIKAAVEAGKEGVKSRSGRHGKCRREKFAKARDHRRGRPVRKRAVIFRLTRTRAPSQTPSPPKCRRVTKYNGKSRFASGPSQE